MPKPKRTSPPVSHSRRGSAQLPPRQRHGSGGRVLVLTVELPTTCRASCSQTRSGSPHSTASGRSRHSSRSKSCVVVLSRTHHTLNPERSHRDVETFAIWRAAVETPVLGVPPARATERDHRLEPPADTGE